MPQAPARIAPWTAWETQCTIARRARPLPQPMDLLPGQSRPSFLWELNSGEHSDLADLAMTWRQNLSNAIEWRLRFLADYPDAFGRDNVESKVGHMNAIQVANQGLCKVCTRVLNHLKWRDIPTTEFGEPPVRWNRSTMADQSRYGQCHFQSECQLPTKRLADHEKGYSRGRKLNRSD